MSLSLLRRAMSSTAALKGPIETAINERLATAFQPVLLEVQNDSHLHAGHAAMKVRKADGASMGETHFTVRVVSDKFQDVRLIQRHRLVNNALTDLFDEGLHSLVIKAKTPQEFEKTKMDK